MKTTTTAPGRGPTSARSSVEASGQIQTATATQIAPSRAAGVRKGFLRRFVPGSEREQAAVRVNGNGDEGAIAPEQPESEN